MGEDVREKCGVIGVYSERGQSAEVPYNIYNGLIALQHRGQESAGISVVANGKLATKKDMGLVSDIFTTEDIERLAGNAGIGHVRYSTTGSSTIDNAQPLIHKERGLQVAISFNGNIVNYEELKNHFENLHQMPFSCSADTELIVKMFTKELKALMQHEKRENGKLKNSGASGKRSRPDKTALGGIEALPHDFSTDTYFKAMESVMRRLEGAYSVALLVSDGTIVAARDPKGFKPFCIGRKKTLVSDLIFVASETCALDALDAQFDRDIMPGEIVVIRNNRIESRQPFHERNAHCMFEWVYFSRTDSVIEGRPVYDVRVRLGEELAKVFKHEVDVIIPIPDSGRSTAKGFARATGALYEEGLIKNRYIHRTFIMPANEQRKALLKLKLNPVKSVISGKRIAIVDDSIIRGNTMKRIVKMLREAGAKEVHVLVSCPPVISPCFMGIDFPTYKELIAADRNISQITSEIGADSITYNDTDALQSALALPENDNCMACLTGVYPTTKIHEYAQRRKTDGDRKTFTIAVLASGRGSNLQSIIDNIENKKLGARVGIVISDRQDAQALRRAEKHGIEFAHIDPGKFHCKEAYEAEILRHLHERNVDLIVLAGYMRIVGKTLLDAYKDRIINIHPTLLPKFKGCMGLKCHEEVIRAGEKESGCTVHTVTEEVDGGPIIGQRKVPVFEGDTPERLADRVLKEEHLLLPEVIGLFVRGKHGC
ncbi:MAG: amidophosphoribosyltransferase [Candidatus Micrarchaeota archaeon]